MDLLKYLEPMKNIPERFSNLAFWRAVRKLKDEVVKAFEYVDSWGDNIERRLSQMKPIDYTRCNRLTAFDEVREVNFHVIEDVNNDAVIIMFNPPQATIPNFPTDFGQAVGVEFLVEMEANVGGWANNLVIMPAEILKIQTGPNTFGCLLNTNSTCAVAIDRITTRNWKKPYKVRVTRGALLYYPTIS